MTAATTSSCKDQGRCQSNRVPQAKILAMQGFQTGAYQLERPMEWGFNGMIKYPYCKQAVCPPSDWDMDVSRPSPQKIARRH